MLVLANILPHTTANGNTGLVRVNAVMFTVEEVLRMRTTTVAGRAKYADFLQHYIPAIIGARKWSGVRQVMLVQECFTYSDEAFLLLCYERKWIQECIHSTVEPAHHANSTGNVVINATTAMERVRADCLLVSRFTSNCIYKPMYQPLNNI
jgi:hypothetical protein